MKNKEDKEVKGDKEDKEVKGVKGDKDNRCIVAINI